MGVGCFDRGARDRAVYKAIDLASAETVRTVLKNLYDVTPNVKQTVEGALLAVEESGEGSGDDNSVMNKEVTTKKRRYRVLGPASGNKRLRPRYRICKQCNKEFDVTENDDTACIWHDGEIEQNDDYNTWADWDERCHGEIHTEENIKQWSEGFLWDCCEKDGGAEGCRRTLHKVLFKKP